MARPEVEDNTQTEAHKEITYEGAETYSTKNEVFEDTKNLKIYNNICGELMK
jgi:hypothetical protein